MNFFKRKPVPDKPTAAPKPPPRPPGPPNRVFHTSYFLGLESETRESKQKTRDYEMFMKGYNFALRRQWERS